MRSSRHSSSTTYLPSRSANIPRRPSSAGTGLARLPVDANIPPLPSALTISTSTTPTHSRFIPRIISNAFHSRRSEEQPQALIVKTSETADAGRRTAGTPTAGQAPPPRLEYVKLPDTKGALMVKSVETAKKRCVHCTSNTGELDQSKNVLVFLQFFVVKTAKESNYLLALIGQRLGFHELSFYLTRLDLWNYSFKGTIWWRSS